MGTPWGCGVSPMLRVKNYRSPRPERWIVATVFVLLLLAVALVVLR